MSRPAATPTVPGCGFMWSDRRPKLFFRLEMGWGDRRFFWVLPLPVLGMLADILTDAAALASRLPVPEEKRLPLAWCRDGVKLLSGLVQDTIWGRGLELSVETEHDGHRLRVGLI